MKYTSLVLLFLVILSLHSCTPKLANPLQNIQAVEYSTSWQELKAYPVERGRSDDLHFFDPLTGFVINSQGYLSYTEDGGESWEIVFAKKGSFFRCITFKNRQEGWLGTLGPDDPYLPSRDLVALYETKDGGKTWSPVQFIGPDPKGLCGLHKINDQVIVGTGRVRGPSYFIKTTDGGKTWYSYDLNHLAGSLIATYFMDEAHGFLIGGTTKDKENSRSMVLETLDGGTSWDTIYLSEQTGEYPWKFSFPSPERGYISIQRNVRDGRFYHLQTEDGGKHWREVEHTPSYYYVQGIGFIDENIGWIGGSQTWTYETRDGGNSWKKFKEIGEGFNNFQFFGDSLAYGVGFGVYKNSDVQAQVKDFQKTYYANGQLRGHYTIKDNKRNGYAFTQHPNGTIASQGRFKDNLKHGKWKYYNEDGHAINKVKTKYGTSKVNDQRIQEYLGAYKTKDGSIRRILLENGQLYSQRGNGRKLPMFPETGNRFFYGFNTDITIEFVSDGSGEISHSITFQDGKYSTAMKMP